MVLTKDSFEGKSSGKGGSPFPDATIYQHGFPEPTNRDEATAEVLNNVLPQVYPGATILGTEIVQTPEHVEAGEFLVKVYLTPATPEEPE